MPADTHDLRQLRGILRLRTMRREQAEGIHQRSREALGQMSRLLEQALQLQRAALVHLGQCHSAGTVLDPAQHEQRLLAQQAGQLLIDERRDAVTKAIATQEQALTDLLAAKVAEDVAVKACERMAGVVRQETEQRERLDIFDSWQPREPFHGL
ncbi:hypothetical protein A0O30_19715 [Pseudomonas sp. LLC-1]|uniref:hypothetical protein n=1 Tax=Pseudomonas sp. LLC-1 TaxID=1812180 RepID=UPI000D01B544|nr:hypothetical protein [Pseudomonas sp. LLC-1]PRN03005.1 hypothetical protein A0O30_19715 [Pseudomonas sp. LLC-1]